MKKGQLLTAAGLLAVLVLGVWLRFDSLSIWLEEPSRYFLADGETPVLLGVDGYYYLDIAREVQQGDYVPEDPRRHYPAGFTRAPLAPLLSVLTAAIAGISGRSLEWVAILLPPFLGALLGIPAFLIGRRLALNARLPWLPPQESQSAAAVSGLVAAAFALISPFMVARSGIGFYETDSLNVFFALLAAYFALRYGDAGRARQRYLSLAGWTATLLAFLWWWEQSSIPVLALTGLPLLVAAIHVGRRSLRDLLPLVTVIGVLLLLQVLWRGLEVLNVAELLERGRGILAYIIDETGESAFAAPGAYVSEQRSVSLERLALDSAGGWWAFSAASGGLLLLLVALRYRAAYLLAIVLVAGLSLNASRFLIFMAPLFGLGVGFLAWLVWSQSWRTPVRAIVLLALSSSLAWGALGKVAEYDHLAPRRLPVLYDAMASLQQKTPENAVIWANWGHGHPLVFYAERATIADGIYHPTEQLYLFAVPLTASDPRLAANWISFGAAHGVPGLRAANALLGSDDEDWVVGMAALKLLLAVGPEPARAMLQARLPALDSEQIDTQLAFLFPGSPRPVYLFLDYLLLEQAWYLQGLWDFATRRDPENERYILLKSLKPVGEGQLVGTSSRGPVNISLERGFVTIGDTELPLDRIRWLEGTSMRERDYPLPSEAIVNIVMPGGLGVYATPTLNRSQLHRLFFEIQFDQRFFRPVAVGLPFFSIWQIKGEAFVPATR
ncbi:MAG: hypothetical protein ACI87W_001047 [Halieaceae bacterium]